MSEIKILAGLFLLTLFGLQVRDGGHLFPVFTWSFLCVLISSCEATSHTGLGPAI